ncbi:cadmium resistance transporter [Mycolicibacterium aubagnense]|uniref:Cadmium transporter n=1 Tax=Mycolicibacterium aubagnense TaxID=319707 RepID=A0ABM8HPI3_9MYCO|nr:cadmium resistance transporter [Mycolicibacterium aubagnense]WGI35311.1 cadmium resistance transporter [Mycolicibacterium aubagnense]BBX82721.1 cadmium transporter [Mycolicibacterium aubagnense]
MSLATVTQAVATFAVTNIDDLVVLAVFFGLIRGHRSAAVRVVAGQYLGFAAIVLVSIGAAFLGATLLPKTALPYLGLLPILLGLRAAWVGWRGRDAGPTGTEGVSPPSAPGVWQVAGVTFANGGDNMGVYVPMFAVATPGTLAVYVTVFLIGVGVWCAAGHYLASHPVVANAFSRWGHIILPVVLIAIGTAILVDGGVFAG